MKNFWVLIIVLTHNALFTMACHARRRPGVAATNTKRRDSLNKKEFIDYTSVLTGVPRYRLSTALEAFIDSTESALEEGKSVRIAGLGEMTVKQRMPSKGRDPRDGSTIEIPAKKKPYFRPGIRLIEAVERGADNWPDRKGKDEDEDYYY